MTLRIGSKLVSQLASAPVNRLTGKPDNRQTGFTLIEVMVTVSILSFGILMLFRSFFISVDAVQYASNRLNAQVWLEEKMWEEMDLLRRMKVLSAGEENGEFKFRGRDYFWRKSIGAMEGDICRLSLDLSWKEAGRDRSLTYATYVNYL